MNFIFHITNDVVFGYVLFCSVLYRFNNEPNEEKLGNVNGKDGDVNENKDDDDLYTIFSDFIPSYYRILIINCYEITNKDKRKDKCHPVAKESNFLL